MSTVTVPVDVEGKIERLCVLPDLSRVTCSLQERYPLPVNPPSIGSSVEPPPPQRVILEVRDAR